MDGRVISVQVGGGRVVGCGVYGVPNEGFPRHKDIFVKGALVIDITVDLTLPADLLANPALMQVS